MFKQHYGIVTFRLGKDVLQMCSGYTAETWAKETWAK